MSSLFSAIYGRSPALGNWLPAVHSIYWHYPALCCPALSLRIGNLLAAHTVPHHGSLPGRGFWHRYCLGKMCLEQVPVNSLAPAPMRFYQCRLGLLKRLSAFVAILHREGAAALVHCNQLVNGKAAIDGLA